MQRILLVTAGLLTILSAPLPASAENLQLIGQRESLSQGPVTKAQVLNACVQNRAETLPNPYTDVAPTHWAYKAVLSLYYCGAFREATPSSLIEELLKGQEALGPVPTAEKPQRSH